MEILSAWQGQGPVKLDGYDTPVIAGLRLWTWREHEVRGVEQLRGRGWEFTSSMSSKSHNLCPAYIAGLLSDLM